MTVPTLAGLAHVLRLGVLPEGYIYPKAEPAVRDILRKRAHLVRQQTAHVLSLHNILVRNTGVRLSAKRIHALPLEERERLLPEPDHVLTATSKRAVGHDLGPQSNTLAKLVHTYASEAHTRFCAAADRRGQLDTAGNGRFAGARQVPGADVWLASETSRGLESDGWMGRRLHS